MYRDLARILFVIDLLEIGGIQRQLLEVVRYLGERGIRCTVACFREERDAMSHEYCQAGAEVLFLGKRRLLDMGFVLRLRRLLRERKFDLVHAMTPQSGFWVSLVLPFGPARPRFVASFLNTHEFASAAKALVERLFVARRADVVWANSRAGARVYRAAVGESVRVRVIHNGVSSKQSAGDSRGDLRRELGIGQNDFVICCVGRLVSVKRHCDALGALKIAANRRLRLFLIGGGPLSNWLQKQYAELFAQGRAVILGERADVQRLLPAFDLFLMPSQSEGLPNALLEAMAAGLPCIATAVGGIPEVITDGRNGLLVAPCDPAAIAQALVRLEAAPKLRAKFREAAYRTVASRFGMQGMLARTEALYRGVVRLQGEQVDVCYVISQFPRISETFILREIVEMRRRGLAIGIVSLKPGQGGAVNHPDALALLDVTLDPPSLSKAVIVANCALMLSHPWRYLRATALLATLQGWRPLQALKALVIWPKALACVSMSVERGCRHLHAHWATIPSSCAMAAARFFDLTFSFTAHAHDIYRVPMELPRKIAASSFVATCTQRNVRHLVTLVGMEQAGKVRLVRHFLSACELPDRLQHTRSPGGACTILSVGSLEHYKGFDTLMGAVKLLLSAGIDARLRIAGGGPLRERLQTQAEAVFGAQAWRISFLGRVTQEQVFSELGQADIFALASRRTTRGPEDNLPNVLVEAALAGVPVVVSRVGAVEEFVQEWRTGLLIEPEDEVTLACQLRLLWENEGLSRQLAMAARARAEALFSVEANAPGLERLLRRFAQCGPETDDGEPKSASQDWLERKRPQAVVETGALTKVSCCRSFTIKEASGERRVVEPAL